MKEQIIAIQKEYVKVVLVEDQLCGSDYPAITHKYHSVLQGYDKAADEILALFAQAMPTITDEEIEAHFTTPHYHYEKGHYYKVRKDRIFGAKWMRDEIRKRMGEKFDGNKSVDETMPTGEAERDDAEDFLSTKDIWNHPRITDRCDKESYEVADLMAEFATAWFRNRMGEKFDGNKSIDESMSTGPRFLSPSPLEREWQEHCLKLMFPEYPNVCSWQVLNSLIINASRGTELGIPEYDDWFRNRMINDCL